MKNKEVFTFEVDGKNVEFAVKQPSAEIRKEAQLIYNNALRENIKAGGILRIEIENILKSRDLWNDDLQKEEDELRKKMLEKEKKLLSGGIRLEEGKKIALSLKEDRNKLTALRRNFNELDNLCAESQAENERFAYYVSACTVYNDSGQRVYSSYQDYQSKSSEKLAFEAASRLMTMMVGVDSDFQKKLPENQFLLEFSFVDDKLRLINKDGKLVDEEGRLINEDGRFIDEEGNFVDIYGNKVDKEGQLVVERKPFIMDDDVKKTKVKK